jgi:hypothetical protein
MRRGDSQPCRDTARKPLSASCGGADVSDTDHRILLQCWGADVTACSGCHRERTSGVPAATRYLGVVLCKTAHFQRDRDKSRHSTWDYPSAAWRRVRRPTYDGELSDLATSTPGLQQCPAGWTVHPAGKTGRPVVRMGTVSSELR